MIASNTFKPKRSTSLFRYFQKHFVRERLAHRSAHTKADYRQAVNKFIAFLGKDAALRDVTERSLRDFRSWWTESHRHPLECRRFCLYLKAICRHAHPRRFAKRPDVVEKVQRVS